MRFGLRWRPGTSLLALAVLLGGALMLAPAAGAQPAPDERQGEGAPADIPGALAFGAGTTTLTAEQFPDEWVDDTVRVRLAAYLSADDSAYGVFSITHTEPTGELLLDARGYIECMRTEGDYAVTIGRITDAEQGPGAVAGEGDVAAVIVQDGGSAGDTMFWVFGPEDTEVNCAEIPAQTVAAVEQGDFLVVD